MNNLAERLIVALDYSDPGRAKEMVEQLSPLGVAFKVGLELFMAGGPRLVSELAVRNRLFLDLKFHDIPNTVAAAVRGAAGLGVWMLNLHAAGGRKMMLAARDVLEEFREKPILLGVTVLTSIDNHALSETGCLADVPERAVLLARLSAECGLDGVICSPLEIDAVKKALSPAFITVTPGVRPTGESDHDQARVATPAEVIRSGGNFLVVGRPITGAADPLSAARKIVAEMGSVQ